MLGWEEVHEREPERRVEGHKHFGTCPKAMEPSKEVTKEPIHNPCHMQRGDLCRELLQEALHPHPDCWDDHALGWALGLRTILEDTDNTAC